MKRSFGFFITIVRFSHQKIIHWIGRVGSKIVLGFSFIVCVMFSLTWMIQSISVKTESYIQSTNNYQKSLIGFSNFRAAVRNRFINHLEASLVSDPKNPERLNAAKKLTEQQLDLMRMAFPKNITLSTEFSEVVSAYTTLDESLDKIASDVIQRNRKIKIEIIQQRLSQIREEKFDKVFIPRMAVLFGRFDGDFNERSLELKKSIEILRIMTIVIAILGSLLTILMAVYFSKKIGAKLRQIELATNEISKGNLGFTIDFKETDNDELSSLANSFNEMAKTLAAANSQITQQQTIVVNYSRMSAVGEMAAGVAHEINNPLAIIVGKASRLLRLARSGVLNQVALIDDLEKINQTTDRIAKIVKGLQMFSRSSEEEAMQSTTLQNVVENTLSLCTERFRIADIIFNISEIPDVKMSCRPAQISQVLLNLLNNAYDAVENNEEKWISLDLSCVNGEKVIFSVMDSGPGVKNEIVDKIMLPFFTTKEVGKGTGLGLSMSKGIVENHGGRLTLDRSSKFTKFKFEIPLAQKSVKRSVA